MVFISDLLMNDENIFPNDPTFIRINFAKDRIFVEALLFLLRDGSENMLYEYQLMENTIKDGRNWIHLWEDY